MEVNLFNGFQMGESPLYYPFQLQKKESFLLVSSAH